MRSAIAIVMGLAIMHVQCQIVIETSEEDNSE